MIASFDVWLQVPGYALEIITQVIEMLHTSSLLYAKPPMRLTLESMMWKTTLRWEGGFLLLTLYMEFLKLSTLPTISIFALSVN